MKYSLITIVLNLLLSTINSQTLTPTSVFYGSSAGTATTSTKLFYKGDKLKIGGLDDPLEVLDVEGDIVRSSSGNYNIAILKVMAAGGYSGHGIYSYGGDMGFGCIGDFHFIGGNGNTHILTITGDGDIVPRGSFILGASQALYSSETNQNAFIQLGGTTQPLGAHAVISARYDSDTQAGMFFENPNNGVHALATMGVFGQQDSFPAPNARYMLMTITSDNFIGSGASITPQNTAILQSGGDVSGGMLIYADQGAIQISNNLTSGAKPCLYIAPICNDSVAPLPRAGFIGINNDDPKARLDVNGTMRLRPIESPSDDDLVDGMIWYDDTHIYIRIGGCTKRFKLE